MAKQTKLFLHAGVNQTSSFFLPGDTTVQKTVFTSGPNDSDLKYFTATSTDTSAVNLQIYIFDGITSSLQGTVRVAAGSGTDGATATTALLNTTLLPALQLDAVTRPYLQIKSGSFVRIAALSTITAAKTVVVFASGNDY